MMLPQVSHKIVKKISNLQLSCCIWETVQASANFTIECEY